MITKEEIDAASATLDDVDIANLVAIIRTSERYKGNPGYFIDVQEKIEALDGSTEAKIVNAVIARLEALGTGNVEVNQAQTVGTDGVVYSQTAQRSFFIDYILNIMYQEYYAVADLDDESVLILSGNYGVGRLPLDYEGYL